MWHHIGGHFQGAESDFTNVPPTVGGDVCEVTKVIRKLGLFSVPQSRAGFVRSALKGPAPRRAASSKARESLCACLGDNSLQHLFDVRNGVIWGSRPGGG